MKLFYLLFVVFSLSLRLSAIPNVTENLPFASVERQVFSDVRSTVVILEEGITEDEARKCAIEKIEEIIKGENFVIKSEGEVAVMRSMESFPMPHNLYYELIQNRNFGRDPIAPSNTASVLLYKGYRIVFSVTDQ